jgi:hypothetical protein
MWLLEKTLALADWLSIGNHISARTRNRALDDRDETDNPAVLLEQLHDDMFWRLRAASILDWYIATWVALEVFVYCWGLDRVPDVLLVGFATYRLIEIAQVFANAVLFERRRSEQSGVVVYMVMSIPRSIVHSVVLLAETILCFGALYFAASGPDLLGVTSGQDALDLAMRAMVGGGGGEAEGALRLLIDLQPLVGLLFAGLVLARLVNALPQFADTRENYRVVRREILNPPPDSDSSD